MFFAKLSEKSLVEKLTEKYEKVFLKTIKGEALIGNEKKLLYEGVEAVEKYIKNYIFNIQYTKNLSKLDKYIIFLLNRLSFVESLEESITDIIRNNIYKALGFTDKKEETFVKNKKNSYFILYVKDLSYYEILTFLKKKHSEIDSCSLVNYNNIEDIEETIEEKAEALLKESKLETIVDKDTYEKIKNVLLGEEKVTKDLQPYLDFLKDSLV